MNIPIYRAKKIDSDKYVEGYYFHQETTKDYENDESEEREEVIEHYIFSYSRHDVNEHEEGFFEFQRLNQIDLSTLAIHFPDMLDGQGNKIFASLQEDGKGGDIMKDDEYYGIAKYKDSRFVVKYENVEECFYEGNFEVIGIQE